MSASPNRKRGNPSTAGAALILTLAILTMVTIGVVAMFSSVSMNARTGAAYANKLAADNAARAGVEEAMALLRWVGETDPAYSVFAIPDGADEGGMVTVVRAVEVAEDPGDPPRYWWLPLTSWDLVVAEEPFVTSDAELGDDYAEHFGDGLFDSVESGFVMQDVQYPAPVRIPMRSVVDANGRETTRYGFMVLDAQARLNPRFHLGDSRGRNEDFATDAREVPIYLGMGDLPENLLTDAEQARLTHGGARFVSFGAYGDLFDTPARRNRFAPFLGIYFAPEIDRIPGGYADGGAPKYSINDLATNPAYGDATERAENIAQIIDRNLPRFKERDRSLSGVHRIRYLNRLAASIVDYIDETTVATAVNGGESAGKGLVPYPTVVAEQYQRTAMTTTSTTIQNRVYVQLWNPHTREIPAGRMRIEIEDRQEVRFGTGIVTPFNDYYEEVDTPVIRPNEFLVVELPVRSQTWTTPDPVVVGSTTQANNPHWFNTNANNHVPFRFYWNGALVDMSRRSPVAPGVANAGIQKFAKTMSDLGMHYQVGLIPTQFGIALPAERRFVGDPRGNYLTNYVWTTLSSDNAYRNNVHWNGRQMDTSPRYQDFRQAWAGRDHVRANGLFGNSAGNINTTPIVVASSYTVAAEAPNAPFYVRKGQMRSIGELGNIYDPAQVDDLGNSPSGGTPSSIYVAGGGRTLRFGRPESAYWNSDHERAALLLDLFTTHPARTINGEDYPVAFGRINLNTAPLEVLQALFYNIAIVSDEGAIATAIDPPAVSAAGALQLANAIVDARPFHRMSDLHRLFGAMDDHALYSPAINPIPSAQPPDVMDRAREELFRKSVNAMTVSSANFLVLAVGQQISPSGRVVSQSVREVVVGMELNDAGIPEPVVQQNKILR